MNTSKISVIMPVYNGAKYLRTAVESVFAQSYQDFTLVVCDDGSSDNSYEILKDMNQENSKMIVLQNNCNLGLFPTLNRLIQATQTPWIRLFAQDDCLKPICLEREVQFAEVNSHVGMYYCNRDTIDDNGSIKREAPVDVTPNIVESWLADQISFFYGSMPGNIANVTLSRKALEAVGFFDESYKVSGDFEMWVRIASAYPIGFIDESLMEIRDHSNQFSRQRDSILSFIREDRAIYKVLRTRLPEELIDYSYKYDEFNRGIQYIHALFASLGKRDLNLANSLLKEIKKDWSPVKLFLLWLISVNRRYFKPKPLYIRQTETGSDKLSK